MLSRKELNMKSPLQKEILQSSFENMLDHIENLEKRLTTLEQRLNNET